jgi:hypothetical protein
MRICRQALNYRRCYKVECSTTFLERSTELCTDPYKDSLQTDHGPADTSGKLVIQIAQPKENG